MADTSAPSTTGGCCGGAKSCDPPAPAQGNKAADMDTPGGVYSSVQEYYGKVLSHTADLRTSACCSVARPSKPIREALALVPDEVTSKFYGCGCPIPLGIDGLTVLDLGSGSGQDCYVVSKLVGPTGAVVGLDMTEEQLVVARAHADKYTTGTLGYPASNMTFVKGFMEDLVGAGVAKDSVNIVISNCVVNLSPDKAAVIQGVYDVLKEGGEFYFSDVYCDRRLPDAVRKHEVLFGECIGGALYKHDFERLCRDAGFTDPRILSYTPFAVGDPELEALTGEAKFFSITYRCFKLPHLETLCEDYGQVAYYNGTIENCEHAYVLDNHHKFETNRPVLVCGNTAAMLGSSWLKPHFRIVGNRDVHYGLFECGSPSSTAAASGTPAAGGDCC